MADINISKSEAVAITESKSLQVFGKGASTVTIFADKYGGTAVYTPLKTPMSGPITITLTSTATETQDRTFTVYIYYEE